MRNRCNVIIILMLLMSLFSAKLLQAKKHYIKSKEPIYIEPTEDTAVIYLLHKNVSKVKQYFAIDDSLYSILPKKTYTVFSVKPGWHLLTVSQLDLKKIESFEIYCYPGETQVLNIFSDYEEYDGENYAVSDNSLEDWQIELKKNMNKYVLSYYSLCHGFYFDRYPAKDLKRILKKNKLKYTSITPLGGDEIIDFFDKCIQRRNRSASKKVPDLKLNFIDAVKSYQLPADPPQWSEDGWFFKLKAVPGNKGLMKLGMSKKSDVFINSDGVDIKNKKKPELNLFIPFENITGFERILMMGKISPPFYLTVNYLEDDEEKQYKFFTGVSNPYISDSCRVYVDEICKRGIVNLDTGLPIHSLDIHETQATGYHKLVNIVDVMFWFEREKAKQESN